MKKKLILALAMAFMVLFSAIAADPWYYNLEMAEFTYSGLKNIPESKIADALYVYRYKPFTDETYAELESKLYAIDGVDFFIAVPEKIDDNGFRIAFEFYEVPMIWSIAYEGNDTIKTRELRDAVTAISVGKFIDPLNTASFEAAKEQIKAVYTAKGFLDVPIEYEIEENTEDNTFKVTFNIKEGEQTRITKIQFSGNEHFDSASLKKEVKSKVKSLFNNGYLDEAKLKTDAANIAAYYQKNGYIDVIVSDPIIEYVESSSAKYREAVVTFDIEEGKQWFYGGMEVTGNTIFTDEEIKKVQSMKVGSVLNLETVQSEYGAIADLYYNEGYIANGMDISNVKDDTNMTVMFYLDITEGPQAVVEQILITGLNKTKEYVMRRELTIEPGEVFSKTKLITSAQNLYNTGLLAGLDYDLMFGQTENGVILDFKLEEGKTKDIQFGATFGGTLNQFPISGFVQWKDRNLFGKAQTLGVGVTLSPDTQSVDLSFGDSWFRNHRWSNSISLGFSRSSHDGELQLGTNAPKYYNGRNSDETWPLGYSSAAQWANSGNEYPSSRDLMKYDLFTLSLGWNTGYTFIYDVGRLSLFGGFSFSRNRAVYDDKYIPFERLINLYRGDKENFWDWKPSRKISFGLQWDGRDYITNTTKGYLLSTSVTYAGGFLGGLSNYIKLNSSAAGYLKLFSVNIKEEGTKNIMLCVSTSASFMFRQLYNYHAAYHDDETKNYIALWDPKYGATKYEMLYIDGMTIGRGFNMVIDQAFLWDNMIEISYPLVENLLQAELFVSATGVNSELKQVKDGINWYFAAGGGIKLKIQGFPLGLYLVKNWTYKHQSVTSTEGDRTWNSIGGSFFNWGRPDRGMSLVLAISTSLI
ncbi:MAG: outer membrane protein assembly factor BamA [Spirochaetales bacterium]|nr:outer membrane protein assembly factor BamA [Spirochaetales bacterium]